MTRVRPSRTTVIRHQSEHGSWVRATRIPDARLRPLLQRHYIGAAHEATDFASWLEPPSPALTLMISLEDPLRTERGALPNAWIAGLDDRPEVIATEGRHTHLDLKLTPIGAYVLCGMPLRELTGQIVPIEEVFGEQARTLTEHLNEVPDWDVRFDLVERLLLSRALDAPLPDPFVVEALVRLHASHGRLRVGQLAVDLRVSRRHLTTRFHEQLGLPPKSVARLLRFERVCQQTAVDPHGWADIAATCGFADQSHLSREFRELAGTTPGDFLARHIPGGGLMGDGITFVQDSDSGPF